MEWKIIALVEMIALFVRRVMASRRFRRARTRGEGESVAWGTGSRGRGEAAMCLPIRWSLIIEVGEDVCWCGARAVTTRGVALLRERSRRCACSRICRMSTTTLAADTMAPRRPASIATAHSAPSSVRALGTRVATEGRSHA